MSRMSIGAVLGPVAEGGGPDFSLEGFGADAVGGEGQTSYVVNTLANSGAGSLRDALSQSNRYITFSVGGTITLSGDIVFSGSYITIDGTSAPSPGITLTANALILDTADHVIIKGLRFRNAVDDGLSIYESHDICVDHCSASHNVDGQDGCIDVTMNYSTTAPSYNVTIQWCILNMRTDGSNGGCSLNYGGHSITHHHNIYAGNARLPLVKWREDGSEATQTTADCVNNISWDWGFYAGEIDGSAHYGIGLGVDGGSHVNSRNCFYQSNVPYSGIGNNTIDLNPYFGTNAKCYANGNYSGNGSNVDAEGNVGSPYSAPSVTTDSVADAVTNVLAYAGCRGAAFGLDATDQAVVDDITNNGNLP